MAMEVREIPVSKDLLKSWIEQGLTQLSYLNDNQDLRTIEFVDANTPTPVLRVGISTVKEGKLIKLNGKS